MWHRGTDAILGILTLLALTACNGTVVRAKWLDGGQALVTSADVRAISHLKVGSGSRHGRVRPDYITCAEPSPDVAKAVAAAFGVGGALSISGLPSGVDPKVALAVSRSYAESLAQLGERLATIQLLRDGLYRACEAYGNGAISETTYTILLSRYDDTMITLLMGELAAGAFGRSLAALGTGAEGRAAASLDVSARQVQSREAEANLKAVEKRRSEKQTELDRAKAAGAPNTAELEREVQEANKEVQRAEQQLIENLKGEASTAARALTVTAAGGITPGRDPQIAQALVTMQRKYLENINSDILEVACVAALDRDEAERTPLTAFCQRELLPKVQEVKGKLLQAILERAWAEKDQAEKRGRAMEAVKEVEEYVGQVERLLKQVKQLPR